MRNVARFLVIAWLFVGCLAILPASAERGGGGGHGGGGGGFHGGGGGFHGGGGFSGGGFRGGYGGFRGGYGGFGRGFYGRGFYGRGFYGFGLGLGFYPYSYWPYYYGYGYPYYGSNYAYGYPYSYPYSAYDYGGSGGYGSSSTPVVVYQSDPAPQVYDPPRPAQPEIREYSQVPSSHSNEKPIYLIAFKNQGNIRAVEAYWVTGVTLHFITLQHEQRQAPLDSVDRSLTKRLNHEHHVNFYLPEMD